MINKLLAIFVIAALLIGVTATVTTFTDSHAAAKPSYSGPGGSGQVESPSLKQCEKQSPGNSPCR